VSRNVTIDDEYLHKYHGNANTTTADADVTGNANAYALHFEEVYQQDDIQDISAMMTARSQTEKAILRGEYLAAAQRHGSRNGAITVAAAAKAAIDVQLNSEALTLALTHQDMEKERRVAKLKSALLKELGSDYSITASGDISRYNQGHSHGHSRGPSLVISTCSNDNPTELAPYGSGNGNGYDGYGSRHPSPRSFAARNSLLNQVTT
jgi:hypothetical protein